MIRRIGKAILLLGVLLENSSPFGNAAVEPDATAHHLRSGGRSVEAASEGFGDVLCRVVRVDVEWNPDEGEESGGVPALDRMDGGPKFVCWTDDDTVLDLKPSLPVQGAELELVDGRDVLLTRVVVASPDLFLTPESGVVPYDRGNDEEGSGRRQRHLAPRSGTSQVLVVRVTYRGTAPTLTASQLAGRVFGIGPDAEPNNLASQTAACSFGKLALEPGTGNAAIANGVVDVSVAQQVTGDSSARSLENLVQAALNNVLGSTSAYEHVMMVFPSHADILSSGGSFVAYGYVGGSRTVYTDQWAGRLSAQLHEVGHNWLLNHSGKGSDR
jgi:hypothetical protein